MNTSSVHRLRLDELVLRTAGVLTLLVLLSACLVSGRLARYISQASGADEARVAVLDASIDNPMSETFAIYLNPETTAQTVDVNVRNDSEVAVRFTVDIEETSNIPLIFRAFGALETDSGTSFHYDSAPGSGETTLTLGIQWDSTQPSYIYSGGVEMLTVTVNGVQID